jgi:hypothetical protein
MEEKNNENELPGEAQPQLGRREELVEIGDIALVDKMTKDELEEYTITRLGIGLDKNERVKLLRLKVIGLIKDRLKTPGSKPSTEKKDTSSSDGPEKNLSDDPEFLFNLKNRHVYEWTEVLAKKEDMIECYIVDEKGKRL